MNMVENNHKKSTAPENCVCPYVRNNMNGEHKEVEGCTYKVSLWDVCKDIVKYFNWIKALIILGISIIIGAIISYSLCFECLREFYYSVLPSLLGFSITVYAILFGINDTVRNRLQQEASDEKKPFNVLHATFAFGIIIQGIILIVGMLSYTLIKFISKTIVGCIGWILLSFIVLWTIHTVLYLFSLRTFEKNNNK